MKKEPKSLYISKSFVTKTTSGPASPSSLEKNNSNSRASSSRPPCKEIKIGSVLKFISISLVLLWLTISMYHFATSTDTDVDIMDPHKKRGEHDIHGLKDSLNSYKQEKRYDFKAAEKALRKRTTSSTTSNLNFISQSQKSKVASEKAVKVEKDQILKGNRILFMAPVYTFDQFLYLQKFIDAAKDHCVAGWNVTVSLQVANGLNYEHPRYRELSDRAICYKIVSDTGHVVASKVPIYLQIYGKKGFQLNSRHRLFLRDHLDDYDLVIFGEEDMIFTPTHTAAWIHGMSRLKKRFPQQWQLFEVGFLRYEDSLTSQSDQGQRLSWEYFPDKIHVVDLELNYDGSKIEDNEDKSPYHYVVTNNLNQASYIFSIDQIKLLEKRCQFLSDIGQNRFFVALRKALDARWKYLAVGVSEWSSSFQQILQCGMRRIVPITPSIQQYMVHHSVNKAQKRRLRKELLSMQDWMDLVKNKTTSLISLKTAYEDIIFKQFNLDIIDPAVYKDQSVWSYYEGWEAFK